MWDITVVIINFNGIQHLDECIKSVLDADGPINEIILVDDYSTDDSVKFVREKFSRIKIIKTEKNSGPCAARNIGIKAAQTDWVCVLDNDVVVDKNFLLPLIRAAADQDDVGVFASRIMVYEEPDIIAADGLDAHYTGMPTLRNAWSRSSEIGVLPPHEVASTGGASILINKLRMNYQTYFDPDFFYGFEEMDLCLRYRMQGYKCLVVPQSVVYHKYEAGGVDGLSSDKNNYSAKRAYFVFRNRWYIILKCYQLRTIVVILPALFLFDIISFLFSIQNNVVRSYFKAWQSIVQNLPHILEKRRALQMMRSVPDNKLLSASALTLGQGTTRGGFESNLATFVSRALTGYWCLVKRFI